MSNEKDFLEEEMNSMGETPGETSEKDGINLDELFGDSESESGAAEGTAEGNDGVNQDADMSEAQTEGETKAEEKAAEAELDELEKEMEKKIPFKKTPFSSKERPKKDIPTQPGAKQEPPKKSPEDEALEVKYMRLMADFQNFRRRTEKEKNDTFLYANEKIVKELLDVVDNFERAFETGTADEGFKTGMEMILKQLLAVLERAGVVEIDCLGQDFDPNFENAVMTEDSTEYDSGKVTKVLQKGYKLHDRVVRPAMVVTAN